MAGSIITGNTQSYQLLLTNFQTALTNPLNDRCVFLTQLLQDTPLKELQYVFPNLVENIFGFRTGIDWGLLTLEKDIQAKEFDSFRKLLAPDGPILKIANKFTEEFCPKFEFSIACLPIPSQTMLQEGKVPALYVNKLQILNPGIFPSTLQLNAFEFYFFHFTYFIVNPTLKNSLSNVNQQDTLYAHLLEDYLSSFLPTDNRAVPLFQTPSNIQHSPILTSSLSSNYGSAHVSSDHLPTLNTHNTSPGRPDFLSPLKQKPSLLKKGTVLMVASPSSNSSYGFGTSPVESWRSETFILILKEIYLNQNTLDNQKTSYVLIPKTFIPSHYHIWMVRIMVKHLHFFFNSTLSSNQSSGHGQIMIDSLGRLKSLGMTQLIQKEMYCFLKSVFDHWPLDASFRVPLETYLSYIQPWRYVQSDLDPPVWQKFMTENLLFYTTIFQQIVRRFLRMDLSCPKNAYMLYRLTKVICTSELRDMIMQAERGSLSKSSNLGLSYIQHSHQKFSFNKNSQLEITGSSYLPLFSEPVFMLVTHLLTAITAAREKASIQNPSSGNTSRSFLAKVCSFFETSDDGINSDDNSPSDISKVASYLETSSKHLCNFFREVSPPTLTSAPENIMKYSNTSFNNNQSEIMSNAKFHDLSMVERIQLLNKKKRPAVSYLGNPDLQPVRTYEVAYLAQFLNEISLQINEKYAVEMQQLYYRNSLLGNMSRLIMSKPTTYYDINKSKDMQSVSWNPVHLPPRISLRIMANRQLLAYFIIYILCFYWYGFNPITSVLILLMFLTLSLFFISLIHPVPIHSKDD
ncbi:sphingomyelin phosphodiesterase 4 [Trichonephila inaurata madagascariensis]|uniref:Sphingomyelin phosphodiesterase 4 n=1 Tax=Trichonephila inaurata madagascariensis TaxID=2747483 RepID=A0A8X6WSH5_9ARAC|nr:sphingomyelin phosphodiesterase 4 [Trichonephila inaurata madagascariensis]